ncbi:DUF6932 family protein [Qipengyuania aquimaris]|uniref:DUF6932 family protein n=1 Tax=Qipengyuania aquimaris TaxID=255984 RepID=UPI001CD3B1E0|nr:hypothetical protein [Qipengyuania aquimaris]MCA0903892.1 hypothetical protein [Qipengyuania aquimaris]
MAELNAPAIPQAVQAIMDEAIDYARPLSFPAFPQGVEQSNPLNSAPYVFSWEAFASEFSFDEVRKARTLVLAQACRRMAEAGLRVEFIMVGGSHIAREAARPKDLDCVIFYSVAQPDSADLAAIPHLQKGLLARRVDARLIPFDGAPILAAKMLGFFTLLYSSSKGAGNRKGMVLVEPPPPGR